MEIINVSAMKARKHKGKKESSAELEKALGRVAEEKIREFRERKEKEEEIVLDSMKLSLEKMKKTLSEGEFYNSVNDVIASFKEDVNNLKIEQEKIDKIKKSLL